MTVTKKVCSAHEISRHAIEIIPCPWCTIEALRLQVTSLESQLNNQSEIALKIHDEHQALVKKLEETRADYEHERLMRDAVQAKLDAVMLEHCPEDMTKEQIEEWGQNQRPSREPCIADSERRPHMFDVDGFCMYCAEKEVAEERSG